jgi:hypothetical protein
VPTPASHRGRRRRRPGRRPGSRDLPGRAQRHLQTVQRLGPLTVQFFVGEGRVAHQIGHQGHGLREDVGRGVGEDVGEVGARPRRRRLAPSCSISVAISGAVRVAVPWVSRLAVIAAAPALPAPSSAEPASKLRRAETSGRPGLRHQDAQAVVQTEVGDRRGGRRHRRPRLGHRGRVRPRAAGSKISRRRGPDRRSGPGRRRRCSAPSPDGRRRRSDSGW